MYFKKWVLVWGVEKKKGKGGINFLTSHRTSDIVN